MDAFTYNITGKGVTKELAAKTAVGSWLATSHGAWLEIH
jgi:hypothetical protein